ncbi:MAG TPA: NrfD/PsrC family molybdoenzyme membrane anchor subunit [Gemmatimonadales bacterium]|jgi:formate-dependent nitrite reductase membrane component NrfD|nr:NrfD/PsrC family molybdoenzyme membrane anchor subunit [Gemmatimonadales bacterium]
MSDTFFTSAPHWTWFIVPYFFIGGLAGGACFLAAVLAWIGRPEDRPVARTGFLVGFAGAVVSGLLLTLDLGRPERFWHMLFQSERLPHLSFKSWSPMSFGAWALLLFGLFSGLAALGAVVEEGRLGRGGRAAALRLLHTGPVAGVIVALAASLGFFVAGYTGVLLSVTNRPIWADSPWLGALFLSSGASSGAAVLVLLGARRGSAPGSLTRLVAFDARALLVELVLLIVFLASLGPVVGVWLSGWGVVLGLGVVLAGIVIPLRLHTRGGEPGGSFPIRAAMLVLLGSFLLKLCVMLASEGISLRRMAERM